MLIEKNKCEKDFLNRLITDTDKIYRLSPYYKGRAYIEKIKDEDIVYMFEKHMPKKILQDAVKAFIGDIHHFVDVVKIKNK